MFMLLYIISKIKEIIVVAAVNIKVKNVQETDVFQISVNCNKGK